jgi:hypothetical protein
VVGDQALVKSAQLRLSLPNAQTIDVELATTDHTHPTPGWTAWRSPSPELIGGVDAAAHLEITAALGAIGVVLTAALDEDALADRL